MKSGWKGMGTYSIINNTYIEQVPYLLRLAEGTRVVVFENYDNLLRAKNTYRGVIAEDHGKWFNVKIKGKAGSYLKSFDKVDIFTGNLTVKIV